MTNPTANPMNKFVVTIISYKFIYNKTHRSIMAGTICAGLENTAMRETAIKQGPVISP
jgi:hypothetical protein